MLVSTGTGMLMVPAHPRVLTKMITPRRYRDPAYAKAIASQLYGGQMRRLPDEVRHLLYEQERLGPRTGYYLQLLAGIGWTSLPALPLIRQPTMVLAGNDDPLIPLVNARIMHALLPHATLHVYDDGHLGLVTSADELGPLVSRFLTSHSMPERLEEQLTTRCPLWPRFTREVHDHVLVATDLLKDLTPAPTPTASPRPQPTRGPPIEPVANEPACAGSPSSATKRELGAPGQRARSTAGDLQRPRASLDLLEPFVDALQGLGVVDLAVM